MNKQLLREGTAVIAVGFEVLVASFALAFPSPALPSMEKDVNFSITQDEGSWVGSIVPGAAMVGSMMAGIILDKYGRQKIMILSTVVFLFSWLGIAVASSVSLVILCRFLSGWALGVQAVGATVFQTEMVHVSMRPKLSLIPPILGNLGLLVVNVSGMYFDWRSLALQGAMMCIPPLFLFMYLPETPYFMSTRGEHKKSIESLTWLRNSTEIARKEEKEYRSSTSGEQTEVSFTDAFKAPFRWGVCVSLALHILQQTTGINAIIFYSSSIFEQAGSSLDPAICSVLMMTTNVLATIASLFILGYGKRTQIMKKSSIYVVLSLLSMSVYLFVIDTSSMSSAIGAVVGMIPVISIIVYTTAFAVGWGPIPWIFLGEGLSSEVRSLGSSLAIAANWSFAFLVTKSFSWAEQMYGLSWIFLFYAFCTAIALVIFNSYLPETVGKSPAQIDKFYIDSYKKKKN